MSALGLAQTDRRCGITITTVYPLYCKYPADRIVKWVSLARVGLRLWLYASSEGSMTRVYIHFTVDAQLHVGLASHGKYIRGPSVGLATFRGLLVVVSRRGGVCSGGRLTHIAL